jgi:hypothetical protein
VKKLSRSQIRTKIEWAKAKVAVVLLFASVSFADAHEIFIVIALFAVIWLGVCAKRLEKRGEI